MFGRSRERLQVHAKRLDFSSKQKEPKTNRRSGTSLVVPTHEARQYQPSSTFMKTYMTAIAIGCAILLVGIVVRRWTDWRIVHQRLVGSAIVCYGVYLATLTGTVSTFVLPGLSAMGSGAAAGAGVGLLTYALIGTVGVVTGGVGIAVGGLAMALIGGGLGLTGALAGGAGFRTVTYPLVSHWFWAPVLAIGVYVFFGALRKRELRIQQALLTKDSN